MAETTGISWADATLNFWIGCAKVSPACDNCYAETWGNRFAVAWGVGEDRRITKSWPQKAREIERREGELGHRPFVFSNSLSDIFDKEVPIEILAGAFDVMRATPRSVYLLLTKRIGIAAERAAAAGGCPPNAAIGATFCNQDEWDRDWRKLRDAQIAMRAMFTFASFEPLLSPIVSTGEWWPAWAIDGGESGPHARPTHPDAFRSVRDTSALVGSKYHHKQNGEWLAADQGGNGDIGHGVRNGTAHIFDDQWTYRVGKKAAGRLLDGVLHDARPEIG